MKNWHRKDTDQSVQRARLETKLVEIVVAELQRKINQVYSPDKPDESQYAEQVLFELKFHGNPPPTRCVEQDNASGRRSDQIVSSNSRSPEYFNFAAPPSTKLAVDRIPGDETSTGRVKCQVDCMHLVLHFLKS